MGHVVSGPADYRLDSNFRRSMRLRIAINKAGRLLEMGWHLA